MSKGILIWRFKCDAVLVMRCANPLVLVHKMFTSGGIGSNGIEDLVFLCCGVLVANWKMVIWSI
jgi:hypothetical protein